MSRLLLSVCCVIGLVPPPGVSASDQQPLVVGGDISAPRQRRPCFAGIEYPEAARSQLIEGLVILQAHVSAEGEVVAAKVLRGLGHGLDQAARQALLACSFEPGRSQATGETVDVLHTIPIRFKLDAPPPEPKPTPAITSSAALAHYREGNELFRQDKLVEAIAEYRNAIELDPDIAMVHNNLGSALQKQGRLSGQDQLVEAISAFRTALAIDPDLAMARYNLGNALEERGDLDEAKPGRTEEAERARVSAEELGGLATAGAGTTDSAAPIGERPAVPAPRLPRVKSDRPEEPSMPRADRASSEVPANDDPKADGPVMIGGEIAEPQQVGHCFNNIQFTDIARAHRIEGAVIMQAVIDMRGVVTDVKVLRGLGYGLDENAMEALRGCRFKPGYSRVSGKPVEVIYTLTVNFKLTSGGSKVHVAKSDIVNPVAKGPCLDGVPYTREAIQAAVEGRIVLHGRIDKRGRVRRVKVVAGLGQGLDKAAVAAFKRCRFKPARRRSTGKNIEVNYSISIDFKLPAKQ